MFVGLCDALDVLAGQPEVHQLFVEGAVGYREHYAVSQDELQGGQDGVHLVYGEAGPVEELVGFGGLRLQGVVRCRCHREGG